MTFNQIAILVAEPLGRALDDSFRAMIKDRVKYWRSRLLRNTLDKDPRERKFFSQPLTVPMEEVNAVDCGLNLNCTLMRSKERLPLPVRANGILFDLVAGPEGTRPFRLVRRHELSFLMEDKYAPLVSDFYLYEDGYILTTIAPYLFVDGIFDDPEKLAEFKARNCQSEGGNDCAVDDQELDVSGDIAQLIVQSILQVDFGQRPKGTDDEQVEVNDKDKPDDRH